MGLRLANLPVIKSFSRPLLLRQPTHGLTQTFVYVPKLFRKEHLIVEGSLSEPAPTIISYAFPSDINPRLLGFCFLVLILFHSCYVCLEVVLVTLVHVPIEQTCAAVQYFSKPRLYG